MIAVVAAVVAGSITSAHAYSAESVPFTAEDISPTGTRFLASHDDDYMPLTLPFRFAFYGTEYETVFAATNGLLSFGGGTGLFLNRPLTGAITPDLPMAAVLWDDWRTNRTPFDAMYHQALGAAGHRRFVVQWHLLQHFPSSPSTVTFQAALYEGSNDIEFRYPDSDSGDLNSFGASATVGLRDASGEVGGRNLQWSHDQAVIRPQSAIRFSANRPPDCSGAAPSTDTLWPPNHKLREVAISGVTDPDGDPVSIAVTGVSHDEAADGRGDGHTAIDWADGAAPGAVRLRAERSGRGEGREYSVAIRATDGKGASCTGSVRVTAPRR